MPAQSARGKFFDVPIGGGSYWAGRNISISYPARSHMPVGHAHNHARMARGAGAASALLQTTSGRYLRYVYITELTGSVVVLRKIR